MKSVRCISKYIARKQRNRLESQSLTCVTYTKLIALLLQLWFCSTWEGRHYIAYRLKSESGFYLVAHMEAVSCQEFIKWNDMVIIGLIDCLSIWRLCCSHISSRQMRIKREEGKTVNWMSSLAGQTNLHTHHSKSPMNLSHFINNLAHCLFVWMGLTQFINWSIVMLCLSLSFIWAKIFAFNLCFLYLFLQSQLAAARKRDGSHAVFTRNRLKIRRGHILEDAFNQLSTLSEDDLRGPVIFWVPFGC